MTDNEQRDGRYEWYELNEQLADTYRLLRDAARFLPELPAVTLNGDTTQCLCPSCGHEDWRLVQDGYAQVMLLWCDEDKTWAANWDGTSSFTDEGDGPEVVECAFCNEVYRRPDNLYYR